MPPGWHDRPVLAFASSSDGVHTLVIDVSDRLVTVVR